jgi:hypothetical protein
LALEGLAWLEEEPLDVASVHDACSLPLIIFRPETAADRTAIPNASLTETFPRPWTL